MNVTKSCLRDNATENQPQRTFLLFGLSPVYGWTVGRRPSGAFVHSDPDRLLLPMISEFMVSPEELSDHDIASVASTLD
jgi:hypothetical protein